MNIERMAIDELTNDKGNTRSHDGRNLQSIKKSLERVGQQKPIVVDGDGVVIAGNGTLMAARDLGWDGLDVVRSDLIGADQVAYAIADNRTAELATWDDDALAATLAGLQCDQTIDEVVTGFSKEEIEELIGGMSPDVKEDEIPEVPAEPITQPGDLIILGDHRLLCGDSTNADDVARLMDGEVASMVHADPPYGMGKEKDGIANDNLYREKLDAFQMAWWSAWRSSVADNGSAYVWGNAADLWRLWYLGGLDDSERMTMRNEITWDKGFAQQFDKMDAGVTSLRSYNVTTERCLFFMLGEQGFNNNADNYWDGWDSMLEYLRAERDKVGWPIAKFKRLAGHSETSGCHWFDRSQWMMPTAETYKSWQAAAKGDAFKREHDDLKREFYATRAHFDNTHDNMTDVWDFPRVTGADRHGHATPKPVLLVSRAIKSSSEEGDCVVVPFAGTCPEVIACEQLDRRCHGMEISPAYCDVIVTRWESLTGRSADRIKEGD
jgi:DNA modification methylase